jgi:hypothetical protein
MNTVAAHSSTIPAAMPPFVASLPHATVGADDAWWVELFGWQAACEEAEPTDERLMRQASLLALLSVA